jgi:hypothetical protein
MLHLPTVSVRRTLGGLGAVVASVAVALPATGQESYELQGDRAAVWNLAGSVSVTGGGSAITVRVRRGGADADRLEIGTGEISLESDGVGRVDALRVVYPGDEIVYPAAGESEIRVRDDGTFYREGRERGRKVRIREAGSGLEAHADLDIEVPRGHTFFLYLAVGEVTVSNVDGDLTVDAGAADVRTSATGGRLLLDSGSGDIEVEGARGDVHIDTGSGDVEIRNVREGPLLADTGSGNVRGSGIEVGSLHVDTGSGDVTLGRSASSRARRTFWSTRAPAAYALPCRPHGRRGSNWTPVPGRSTRISE